MVLVFLSTSTYKLPGPFYQNEESDWSVDVNRWIVITHPIAINARHDQIYFWWWIVSPLPLAVFFYLDPSNYEKKKKMVCIQKDWFACHGLSIFVNCLNGRPWVTNKAITHWHMPTFYPSILHFISSKWSANHLIVVI